MLTCPHPRPFVVADPWSCGQTRTMCRELPAGGVCCTVDATVATWNSSLALLEGKAAAAVTHVP